MEQFGPGSSTFGKLSGHLAPIHESLAVEDYDKAAILLNNLDAEIRKSRVNAKVNLDKETRLNWLESYFDLFQKFAILALIAFLLTQNTDWREALKTGTIPQRSRFIWVFLAVVLGSVLRIFDLSRYGDSVWAFFDIQVVFAALAGMMGGPVWGILGGAVMAVLRWFSMPGMIASPAVIFTASVCGVVFTKGMKDYTSSGKRGFFCGALAGFVHGLIIYLPAADTLLPGGLIISIGLVTLFEAAGVAVFFAVISAVLQNDLKKDTENKLLKTQLLFLQAQLNPHFFFNALNTIAAICSRERAEGSRHLVLKLADFLRHSLKREGETVTLREEMDFINDYLEIEKARFQDELAIEKTFDAREATWDTKIPIMIFQPLVENAIKHGIRKKERGGCLRITVDDRGGKLKVEIEDNGAGAESGFFDRLLRGENVKIAGLGIGVRNIQQRLARHFEGRASIHFESVSGGGVKVTVTIPLEGES